MSSCPHTTHRTVKSLIKDRLPISFCRDGCSRTFFFCPHCEEANHPLARYCRKCSKPISFEATEANGETVFDFDGLNENRLYNLSGYGINEVYDLKSYRGHLIVIGETGTLVFDINNLYEPLNKFQSPDGKIGH